MAPKRKSDATEIPVTALAGPSTSDADVETIALEPSRKKPRVAVNPTTLETSSDKDKLKSWRDIKLPGEDADGGGVPVYDDCGDIRRKINLLLKTPNFKVTPWLKELGINHNSYTRFMKTTGREKGAGNGTYYAAYVYFEKIRVFEGKKKTPKRKQCEDEMPNGYALERATTQVWFVAR